MKIVVTGLGMINSLGLTVAEAWPAIKAGTTGITRTTIIDVDRMASEMAGQVHPLPIHDGRGKDRTMELNMIAAREAIEDSGIIGVYDSDRIGVIVGTCMGANRHAEVFHTTWLRQGLDRTNIGQVLSFPMNGLADDIAAEFDLHGPRTVVSNACAAGGVAIGYGMELLWSGAADAVICGGSDSLGDMSFAGFSSLSALDAEPTAPYSRSTGLNLGEGSGFLILERADAVADGRRKSFVEVAGYGLSADAYHPTAPDPSGRGAMAAIQEALRTAEIEATDVDYLNGHGTGTTANDKTEVRVVQKLRTDIQLPMSSTKSMLGHSLGASGAIEAVVTVKAIEEQFLPPTVNVDHERNRHKAAIDIVPGVGRPAEVNVALSNSFAFGGNNSSVAFRRIPVDFTGDGGPQYANRPVAITAIDVHAGRAFGKDELLARITEDRPLYMDDEIVIEGHGTYPAGITPSELLAKGINPSMLRKMDALSRAGVGTAARAVKAGPARNRAETEATGVMFATVLGCAETVQSFHADFIDGGEGNSRLFPNAVMNAAAGQVSLVNRFHGPTATVAAGGTSAVTSLHFAQLLIARGAADRILVVAADEATATAVGGFARIPGYFTSDRIRVGQDTGIAFSTSSAAVLLEAEETVQPDQILARIKGYGFGGDSSGLGRLKQDGVGWAKSFAGAMDSAGWKPEDVDMVFGASCGRRQMDDPERRALEMVGLDSRPSYNPKEIFGETSASAPLLSLALANWLPGQAAGSRSIVSAYAIGGNYQALAIEVAA